MVEIEKQFSSDSFRRTGQETEKEVLLQISHVRYEIRNPPFNLKPWETLPVVVAQFNCRPYETVGSPGNSLRKLFISEGQQPMRCTVAFILSGCFCRIAVGFRGLVLVGFRESLSG